MVGVEWDCIDLMVRMRRVELGMVFESLESPVLESLRQEDCEVGASLNCMATLCLRKNNEEE